MRERHKVHDAAFQALAVELAQGALVYPSNFSRRDSRLFISHVNAPVGGTHRDAEPIDTSNNRVIRKDLEERFPDQLEAGQYGSWLVGWTESILVPLFKEVGKCHCGFTSTDIEVLEGHAEEMKNESSRVHDMLWACDGDIAFDNLSDIWLACVEWVQALADYPVADDDDHSREEQDRTDESWDNWGARAFEDKVSEVLGGICVEDDGAPQEKDFDWRKALVEALDKDTGGNEIWGHMYSGEPSINDKEFDAAVEKQLLGLLRQPEWLWLAVQVEEGCDKALESLLADLPMLRARHKLMTAAAHKAQRKLQIVGVGNQKVN